MIINLRYSFDDKAGNTFMEKNEELNEILGKFIPEDMFPPIRYIYKSKPMKEIDAYMENEFAEYMEQKFRAHEKTFTRGGFGNTLLNLRLVTT